MMTCHRLIVFLLMVVDISICISRRVVFTVNDANFIEHFNLNLSSSLHSKSVSAPDDWVVDSYYQHSYSDIGWDIIEFTMNPEKDESKSTYMAGYAEGFLTQEKINQHWKNTIGDFCQSKPVKTRSCRKLQNFLQTNLDWMVMMIDMNKDNVIWREVKYVLLQLQGLIDGFRGSSVYDPSIRIEPFGLLLLQLAGDLAEIETALGVTDRLSKHTVGSGSCSGFIKIVSNLGQNELYSSHATWTDYNMMLRFMKRYNFANHTSVFSGYPGMLFSGDDFYILSSGLVTMETTNGNYNVDLWQNVKPQTLLEWVRTLISNRHAKNAQEWCSIFEKHNSGTYNNQWMIVDYNKFMSGSDDQVLFVLEQLPGEIEYSDISHVLLQNSYWGSYNIPYFPNIYNNSGMPELVEKYGDYFTHEKNPRAKIFARDHETVTDLTSLIKLIRYNDFEHDPIASCNCSPPYSATNAVAARCDLNVPDGVYPIPVLKQRNHGATDFKATSSQLMKNFGLVAESGPTHDQQPVFEWSKSPYADSPHEGHPDRFDFKPELFLWEK